MKYLRGVMFPVWVHGYAGRMWHAFVFGVCGVLRGQHKVSDLNFSYVLVRPSLILHCAGYEIVEPLDGFSSVAVRAASAVIAQHGQPQDPLGFCTTFLAASACPAPALEEWGGQPPFPLHSQCLSCAGWRADEVAFRGMLLALFVGGYAKEVVTSLCLGVLWCLRTPLEFSDFGCSYVKVWLHVLLRFAGCGFECLLPCWVFSCLSGCTPFPGVT